MKENRMDDAEQSSAYMSLTNNDKGELIFREI